MVAPAEELKVSGKPMTDLSDEELKRYITARSGDPKRVANVIRAREILDARATTRTDDESVSRMVAAEEQFQSELPIPEATTA